METNNQTPPERPKHRDVRPDRDDINRRYSPYFTTTYFDLLNVAYTGELDRFKMVASSYDNRGDDGLATTIQRLVDDSGTGSLAFAAAGGSLDVCRYLVEELNLEVDVKNDNGLTPLCFGAVKGHLNTVEYLLEKGANPDGSNDPDSTTNTPLHYAVLGSIRIDVATESGTALSYAVILGQLDAVKVLLDHHADAGADPNAKSCGHTPLQFAAIYGLTQSVVLLLEDGADPNALNGEGMTSIEIAAKYGNRVEILFPVMSCIPTYPNWTTAGLMEHVHSEAARKKKRALEGFWKLLRGKKNGAEAFREKKYVLASYWYSEALEVAPRDATLLSNRSACYARTQEGSAALKDATECIYLRPDWPKAYYRAGVAFNILKRHREAADAFLKGLKLAPENKELVDAFRNANEARLRSTTRQS